MAEPVEIAAVEGMRILGIPVSIINLDRTVSAVMAWSRRDEPHTVFVRDVASLMAAKDNANLTALHEDASLIVPDGMPLVWIGRSRGFGERIGRVAGADLVEAICKASLKTGQSHYFYGGKPKVAQEMVCRLMRTFPGLKVAGTCTPPMRAIDSDFTFDDEALAEIAAIRESDADFIWVGISSPKQEFWMMKAAPLIGRGVFCGVGAAFDFHSGAIKRAPRWMRDNGLEWVHRLFSEPRRLWKRYLVLAPRFIWLVLLETLYRRSAPQGASSTTR